MNSFKQARGNSAVAHQSNPLPLSYILQEL